jgi:hypothetical protein
MNLLEKQYCEYKTQRSDDDLETNNGTTTTHQQTAVLFRELLCKERRLQRQQTNRLVSSAIQYKQKQLTDKRRSIRKGRDELTIALSIHKEQNKELNQVLLNGILNKSIRSEPSSCAAVTVEQRLSPPAQQLQLQTQQKKTCQVTNANINKDEKINSPSSPSTLPDKKGRVRRKVLLHHTTHSVPVATQAASPQSNNAPPSPPFPLTRTLEAANRCAVVKAEAKLAAGVNLHSTTAIKSSSLRTSQVHSHPQRLFLQKGRLRKRRTDGNLITTNKSAAADVWYEPATVTITSFRPRSAESLFQPLNSRTSVNVWAPIPF